MPFQSQELSAPIFRGLQCYARGMESTVEATVSWPPLMRQGTRQSVREARLGMDEPRGTVG